MGWIFIGIGLLLAGIAAFLGVYGQQLLSEGNTPKTEIGTTAPSVQPILRPQQERLLGLLYKYQLDLAASKLIISREGTVHLDKNVTEVRGDLIADLYGSQKADETTTSEFNSLMEQMPTEYLRYHAEGRFDNPFVVTVTEAGIRYLRFKP